MQSNTKVWDEAAKACTPSVRVDFVMESTLRACGPGLLNNGFYCCPETCSRLSVGLEIESCGVEPQGLLALGPVWALSVVESGRGMWALWPRPPLLLF